MEKKTKKIVVFLLICYFCRPFLKKSKMYAIVEIAGQQFKVEKDQQIFVHRLDAKEGSKVSFDKVLLTDDNGKDLSVGKPVL